MREEDELIDKMIMINSDDTLILLIISILKEKEDYLQMLKWIDGHKSIPTPREMIDKAEEITGDYGE